MTDRRLQVFHAVATHLSFTKAADALFMTQPAVTAQVRHFEELYGTRLFDRAQGRILLTAAGAMALEYAERILAQSAELDHRLREFSGEIAGLLVVGASTTIADFLLPQVFGEFKARHPMVKPRLFVANSETVQDWVTARTLDLGFIEGDSHLPTLASDACCEDELRVMCAPSHPLASQCMVLPAALVEHPYISREPGSGTREVVGHYLQKAGVASDALQVAMEVGSPEAIKGLVASGMGFAILSRASVTKEIRLGLLVEVPLAPPLVRHMSVVYPKERFQSRLVNAFVEFAKAKLSAAQQGGR